MLRWMLVAAACLVPAWAVAQVNAIPSAPHLLVKGHAEGHYVPDRFTIRLRIAVTDMVPDKARSRVETHMQALFAALEDSHALRERTRASSLQIEPDEEYRDGKSVFLGTSVSRTLSATFATLDQLRVFIGRLQAGEEVQVSGVDVARSDIDRIKLDLRQRAIANSKQAAERISESYGMRLKGVYSVSEVAPDFAYGIQAGSWGAGGGATELQSVGVAALAAPPPKVVARMAPPGEDLRAGTIDVRQDIYAVYLTVP